MRATEQELKSTFITYLSVKVAYGGRLDVFLAQYFHLDRRVGEVEGKVVQEVGQVGSRPVDHRQGINRCTFWLLCEGQLQELPGEALHLSRTEARQLVSVSVQHAPAAVGLLFLVNEASVSGTGLEAEAADVVVLMREERDVTCFESLKVRWAAVSRFSDRKPTAFLLYCSRLRSFWVYREREISS